jgi:hypothetical protein
MGEPGNEQSNGRMIWVVNVLLYAKARGERTHLVIEKSLRRNG